MLRDHRFCNVRRMDDKVSLWLMDNWYDDTNKTMRIKDWLALASLARMINWPDTLAAISPSRPRTYNANVIYERLQRWVLDAEHNKLKVFTGAYIINGASGGPKWKQVLDNVYSMYQRGDELMDRLSLEATHARLTTCRGFGSFIAGQVVADLYYTPAMSIAKDAMTWAPIGPGSRRGMNRLLGKDKRAPLRQKQFTSLMMELIKLLRKSFEVNDIFVDRGLTAMDIQNCLCEYDKFRRLQNKEGSVRSKYPGAA